MGLPTKRPTTPGRKKKKRKAEKVVLPDYDKRALTDMRMFYRSIDWAAYWEEWYLGVDEKTGKKKYTTIFQFASAKSHSREQRKFLEWYLGPVQKDGVVYDKEKTYCSFAGTPVDWAEKKKNNGWFTDTNLKLFGKEITRRMNALDALREAGNSLTLHSLVRAENLAQQIDVAFQGTMFLPDLPLHENINRANAYVNLQRDVLALKEKAQELYAKCHGVNFNDMHGLVELMTATTMAASIEAAKTGRTFTKEEAAVSSLVKMVVAKAGRYNLPLPEGAEGQIIDAVAEVEETGKRKKQLN